MQADGGRPHAQGGEQADHIGQAGNGGGPQPGLDGKGNAKGGDQQSQAQQAIPPDRLLSGWFHRNLRLLSPVPGERPGRAPLLRVRVLSLLCPGGHIGPQNLVPRLDRPCVAAVHHHLAVDGIGPARGLPMGPGGQVPDGGDVSGATLGGHRAAGSFGGGFQGLQYRAVLRHRTGGGEPGSHPPPAQPLPP